MIQMMWVDDAEEAHISSLERRLYAKHDVIDHEISVDDAQASSRLVTLAWSTNRSATMRKPKRIPNYNH